MRFGLLHPVPRHRKLLILRLRFALNAPDFTLFRWDVSAEAAVYSLDSVVLDSWAVSHFRASVSFSAEPNL